MKALLRFFFLLIGGLICVPLLQSQVLHYRQGELLVKLKQENDSKHFLAKLNARRNQFHLNGTKPVVPAMNIHKFSFDFNSIDETQMIDYIASHPEVETVQFNHLIKKRQTTPDDPRFDDQWQYINTGQLPNGVINADLDIEWAWDVTTGGVTATGDTIVVCVIDDGLNPNHQDFGDNLWTNHGEIPGNSIDDDGNGYVDDIHGYDIFDDDGDPLTILNFDDHGTPVAGIIGAKGNNGSGVAGINWNVKLMIIRGFGDEEEALAAYSYPLEMRRMYNQTNGAQGAFVVATNASWGTDQGQPEDAPLWCAMYDSLGLQGVLNCGATANRNFDIDVVGDLPTACPSDYLLSVTNLDESDEKVTQAGYGLTTIDLGAYGENTETVATPNGYEGFGGTSGATPHVTGAVGLLYASPCVELANLARSDPPAAALLVRSAITSSVTPNASLDGITVTGGRLNINNAMQYLLGTCGPCPNLVGLQADPVGIDSLAVSWSSSDSAVQAHVEYREVGMNDWNVETSEATLHYLTLLPCQSYEIRVKAICATDTSMYSNVITVKTDGCCDIPLDITTTDVSEDNISLEWNGIAAATEYTVRYRRQGVATWAEMMVVGTQFNIATDPCNIYEIQIQSICADSSGDFSESLLVSVPGCGFCLDLDYCEQPSGDSEFEYINSFTFGEFINASGDNGGNADFTALDIPVAERERTYTVQVVPGANGVDLDENYILWIDFNADGEFEESEEVIRVESTDTLGITGEVTIPEDARIGATRMRLGMRWRLYPDPCGPTGISGEFEDYCITIDENSGVITNGPDDFIFDVYPNPMVDHLIFRTNDFSIAVGQISIFNEAGKLVRQHAIDLTQNDQRNLDVTDLSAGLYFVRYLSSDGNFTITRKLVKL